MNEVIRDPRMIAAWHLLHVAVAAAEAVASGPLLRDLLVRARYGRYLAEFGQADSDVYVATYSRSGTTWMQLSLFSMTTNGDLSFDHLFDVSPWIYYSALRGTEPVWKVPAPRILKTHDESSFYRQRTRGRFIVVLRDGKDVMVSLYHHRRNAKGYNGSFEEHVKEFLYGPSYNWFSHVRGWLENPGQHQILCVYYEDMIDDYEAELRRVAQFLDLRNVEAALARASKVCTFASMKTLERQLGPRSDHFPDASTAPYRIRNGSQFVRKGIVGDWKNVLTSAHLEAYRARFDSILGDFPQVTQYR